MQKVTRKVAEGIVQITTLDERWYELSKEGEEPKYIPSVTWICSYYPKGTAFYKWLANKGWDESVAIKEAAGNRGNKVHAAIADLIAGYEVKIDDRYINRDSGEMEELTVEEYRGIMSFVGWHKKVNPVYLATEKSHISEELNCAGTIDLECEIVNPKTKKAERWIIDLKTSAYIWPEHELQVSAYKHIRNVDYKLGILQVGFKRNKAGFKFTEVEDKFDIFMAAQDIWHNETKNVKPLQRDYPEVLTLNIGGDDV